MTSGNGNIGTAEKAEMAEMAEMVAGSRLSCYDLATLSFHYRRVLQEIEGPASHEVQMHLVSDVLQFDLRVSKTQCRPKDTTPSEER